MTPRITGSTRLVGIIGCPVRHSRSPQMMAAAFEAAGLDMVSVPMPVERERVGEAVLGLRALGFVGCNVTLPHKMAVMAYLNEISPAARGIGAVNTIHVTDDGKLVGHNTDVDGAHDALSEETGVEAAGRHVVVLGAGGAARAIAWGAGARGASRVTLVNRTVEKAEALAQDLFSQHSATEFRVIGRPTAEDLSDAAIVFQMTSLGMKEGDPLPLDPALLPEKAVGLEAVYSPLETAWLRAARNRGLKIVDGLAMLVSQGARSFEIWTGREADIDAMRRAL